MLNGDSFDIVATIANVGETGLDSVSVRFYVDASLIDEQYAWVDSFSDTTLTTPTTLTSDGSHAISVVVDEDNIKIELDDTNNESSTLVYVGQCVDTDGDGYGEPGNVCPTDNCPSIANPDQADADGDGVGDVCDICPGFDDNIDTDSDGTPDGCDTCPTNPANPCCCAAAGDADGGGDVNIGDAIFIVKYIFTDGDVPPCLDQADADGGNDVNIGDAIYIVKFIFQDGEPLACGTTGG